MPPTLAATGLADSTDGQPADPGPSAVRIALTGAASLAVVMGVGRFAFTPVLPLMLADGRVDIAGGSLLATANYSGYLLGAMAVIPVPLLLRRAGIVMPSDAAVARVALAIVALLTFAMALDLAPLWPGLRFVTGLASAFGLVHVTAWTMRGLNAHGRQDLGGLFFTGPCAGIILTGVLGWILGHLGAGSGLAWAVYGCLALALSLFIRPVLRGTRSPEARAAAARAAAASAAGPRDPVTLEQAAFSLAYLFEGFGYIITATFLPVIARGVLGDNPFIDLFWPMFGVAGVVGALLTQRISLRIDSRLLLAIAYLIQAFGAVLALLLPSGFGFAAGAMLLGLPFTAITLFAVREAGRQRPNGVTGYVAFLSAALGVGQIIGPPVTAWAVAHAATPEAGFAHALEWAGAGLLAGAVIYVALVFLCPRNRPLRGF